MIYSTLFLKKIWEESFHFFSYSKMKTFTQIFLSLVTLSVFLIQFPLSANIYKGAEYRTKDAFTYGRFEVRMKAAHRDGMLSSFFTYFDGTPSDPWAAYKWNEIDLEIMGRYDDNIQFNTITPEGNHVSHYPMSASPVLDYHTYAFEWTPDYVAWFVDGVEVLRQTGDHIATLTRPQKIMMNVWNPLNENWAGVFNPLALPAFAYYDWVSYYSYTPGSGNYGTGNNFMPDWTDNFDSYDTTRWEKGIHTFGGNGCDFIEENAVFDNGKLILCLTNQTNIGYTDVAAPSILWARASADKVLAMFSEEIDKTSAENIANYIIPNVTINSAKLKPDLKSVELSVTGLVIPSTNIFMARNIKDLAAIPNTMDLKSISLIMPQLLSFPIKINCGGTAALDYLPDANLNQNTDYGSMDGTIKNYDNALQISGTDEDVIYQSEKNWLAGYKIRLPNGHYDVKLLFAENSFNSAGTRIFDIYLEYNRVIQDLDIFSQVGQNAALVKEITNVQVNDEVLDIQFAEKVDNALINGIIITPNTTGLNDEDKIGLNDFKVEQNYPNPFNGKTIINYSLQSADNLSLKLYNILGEQIFFKDLGYVSEGLHQFLIDAATINESPLTSGIYFYVISTSQKKETRKMVLLN